VATLDDGTTIAIDDVRESLKLPGILTIVTVPYTAGPDGHHPAHQIPVLTPSGGEALRTGDLIMAYGEEELSEVLAPNFVRSLELSFASPIAELTNAQLLIDGELIAGDFTNRVGAPTS